MRAFIKDIAYVLPKKIVTNDDLICEFPEWNAEKITEKIGVNKRHIVTSETATDMAVEAAEKLFAHGLVEKNEVDFILFCTQSPDYKLPTSACIIQDRLGLPKELGALDFDLGCSGYEYGLALSKGLILAGIAQNILLLTGDTYSKYIHPKDKGNRTIFGDAASATIISNNGFAEIGEFVLGTDGKGKDNLIIKTGAAKIPEKKGDLSFDTKGTPSSSDYLFMNGAEIFTFTLSVVPKMINDVLKMNGLNKSEISLFIFHQANKYLLNHLRKKLKINEDLFYMNLFDIGNTVSSTIPIALCDAYKEGKVLGNVLLAGFGVGYSWGSTILKIH